MNKKQPQSAAADEILFHFPFVQTPPATLNAIKSEPRVKNSCVLQKLMHKILHDLDRASRLLGELSP